ncbi:MULTISPECIES: type II restriction endonuclease [Halomonadaceae]|uniref:Restriction endonuclease n=1 Tax=Vreelandella halophila TaxID=86177 RepID=A0A9X4YC51_9GAMM|nr:MULTISPECIES: type II restriction endonuclease [Halomonas]MYL26505.1 restriction endonuclease [Halomonas utahensis]MYL73842.1 restriction endonuclease [Halomonas sp. 22501_18_FS]
MTRLSDHFSGVSAKRLSIVETSRSDSNQHEFNGTAGMRQYLGKERSTFPARFIYIGNDEEDRLMVDDHVTWYDSRERHPNRSEHRLYFRDNDVMNLASEGDVMIAALDREGNMLLVIVSDVSQLLGDVLWLFGLGELPGSAFITIETAESSHASDALFYYIAEQAGIQIEEKVSDSWLDLILERFGPVFPRSRQLSALALESLDGEISPVEEPDNTLIRLLDREERMFRELERHIVSSELRNRTETWAENVDDFISFSLGVHNRRKSRAGHSLENHLEWIFTENRLEFQRGVHTENRSKPDFLFPGSAHYQDPNWPADRLTMLGVKTSCKDRWRQVLNEAARIPEKHLLTLQPGISEHQTREMDGANLRLVLPRNLHRTYSTSQQSSLMDLDLFINEVLKKQAA